MSLSLSNLLLHSAQIYPVFTMEIVDEVHAHDIINYAYTPTLYSEDVLFGEGHLVV